MKINFKKIVLLLSTMILIIYVGISYVLPRVILKLSREVSTSTAADFGMRYDKVEVQSDDSLILYGDFIYPFERNYNQATSSHSMIVLHPLKQNTKSVYPLLKSFNNLDVNFITFDIRAHGRSEGHLYTMGIKEAKDVSLIIDYILELHPDHSFGIYARGNTGNIALKAMENDSRIRYGIIENFYKHPLETLQRFNYDDVFVKNKTLQDYILKQSMDFLDLNIEEHQPNLQRIDRPVLLLKTEYNKPELDYLESLLVNSEIYHMYFPENNYLLANLSDRKRSSDYISCVSEFLEMQSLHAIQNSKESFFISEDRFY